MSSVQQFTEIQSKAYGPWNEKKLKHTTRVVGYYRTRSMQLGSTKTLHKHTIQFWGHTTASVAVTSGEGEVIGSMDMESLVCVLRHMKLVIPHSHQ